MTSEADETNVRRRRRELSLVVTFWAVLAAAMILLARQNLSVPGLYYDEAVFAGMAKDFITGNVHGEHMPDHQVVRLAGRPFPLFIQTYLGALKSWMLIPAFRIFGPTVAVLRATTLFWSLIALLLARHLALARPGNRANRWRVARFRSDVFFPFGAGLGGCGSELPLPVRLLLLRDSLESKAQIERCILCRSLCRTWIF